MLNQSRLGWGAAILATLFALGCGSKGDTGDPGAQGPAGTAGPAGDPGADGTDGTDGTTPALVNDINVTVTDGTSPLEGVDVTASPGTAAGKTDASGAASLKGLDVGAYTLTFHLDGYIDQTVTAAVNLSGATKVSVALAVDPTKGTPPAIVVSDNLLAGFGQSVTLQAMATGKGTLTYSWQQTSGPEVALSGDTTDTLSFTTVDFATAMGPGAVDNARFGAIGVNPDQAGNYAFQVTVTDSDGRVSKATVIVNSTRPTDGLRDVAVGVPVWLQGDGKLAATTVSGATGAQTTWNWSLDKTGAAGSNAVLMNATGQFPSFTPDVKGTYKLTESVSKKTMTIYAGTWLGEMTADGSPPALCGTCHNGTTASDNFATWKNTRHFKGLADKLDGISTQHFTEECMSCHTVGYDKTASNGGFDDLEAGSGWTFPTTLQAGNWDTLVNNTKLGPLAGIQCENCHGPHTVVNGPHTSTINPPVAACTTNADCTSGMNGAGFCDTTAGKCVVTTDVAARASISSDVCSSCHQEEPYHYKPGQWANSAHSNLSLAINEGSVERNANNAPHCGRCHSGQGFLRYASQLGQDYYAYLTSDGKPLGAGNTKATTNDLVKIGMTAAEVQPITCAACHDPHDVTNPSQLRVYDKITMLPNGMGDLKGMGSGAICVTCHNSRNGEHTDVAQNTTDTNGNFVAQGYLFSFSGPHSSSQGDAVFGFNTYFGARYNPSAHLAVKDSCAGCHYAVATAADQSAQHATNHSFGVDNSICKACHSDNVDGAALQAANDLQIEGLRALIAAKTKTTIANAVNYVNTVPAMDVLVRAYDPVSNSYSTSSSTLTPTTSGLVSLVKGAGGPNPPLSVGFEYAANGTTLLLVLNLANPVTFQPTGTGAAAVTTSALRVAFTGMITNQPVSGGDATYYPPASAYYSPFSAPGPKTSGTPAIVGAYPAQPTPPPWVNANDVQTLYKAYWNMSLLVNDATKGIHNPKFFNTVVTNTTQRLMAMP